MERVTCPGCGKPKAAFTIRDGKCDEERRNEARAGAQRPAVTWNDIRGLRSIKLQQCDWTQVADADLTTEEKSAWATYRQALRDLPETYPDPASVQWPTPPS